MKEVTVISSASENGIKIFKEQMAENFFNLAKIINIETQEA